MHYTISTVHKATDQPHFYLQSHGEHAGRPLKNPIPNSFQVITTTIADRDMLYWTCMILKRSRKFWIILRGSVIPFIALYETKKVLHTGIEIAQRDPDQFLQLVTALKAIDQHIEKNKQLNLHLEELSLSMTSHYR